MSLLSPSLEAFVAVAKHRTVHAAAKELGLTQTGVTQRVRALESRLSTTLFTRSRRGMSPTPEGEALLRYCQAASELEGETLSKIQAGGLETGVSVAVSGPTSVVSSRLVPQCLEVMRAWPQLNLAFDVDDLASRVEKLRTGKVQFAVIPRENVAREMDSKLLRPEKYILVGSGRWKGRSLKDILSSERIVDFDPSDEMTHLYLKKYRLLESARPERHFVNNNSALLQLFTEGLGYGVLLDEVARPHLDSGDLIPLHPSGFYRNEIALAWYPRAHMPGYFKALLKAIH